MGAGSGETPFDPDEDPMRPTISVLLVAALALLVGGCSDRSVDDRVVTVASDDAEMNAAIARARETLPHFWEVFEKPARGESDFALKVEITEGSEAEHFWLIDIERRDGKTFGTINNEPEFVDTVRLNERIAIPEADISDWMYMREGKMVGNYTIRPLFKQMSPDEAG